MAAGAPTDQDQGAESTDQGAEGTDQGTDQGAETSHNISLVGVVV